MNKGEIQISEGRKCFSMYRHWVLHWPIYSASLEMGVFGLFSPMEYLRAYTFSGSLAKTPPLNLLSTVLKVTCRLVEGPNKDVLLDLLSLACYLVACFLLFKWPFTVSIRVMSRL